jgi:hypothetical protein
MDLQRTIGNRAVVGVLQRMAIADVAPGQKVRFSRRVTVRGYMVDAGTTGSVRSKSNRMATIKVTSGPLADLELEFNPRDFEAAAPQGPAAAAAPQQPVVDRGQMLRDQFGRELKQSRDLKDVLAKLRQTHAGDQVALDAVTAATADVEAIVRPEAVQQRAATAGMLDPLKGMKTLAELTAYCEQVAQLHGISPLDSIEDFVNDAANKLPIQNATLPGERTAAIAAVERRWDRAQGGKIGPQLIDPSGRLPAGKKTNVGPEASHAETIQIEGNRRRQLILGVGRPGDPQGYQDFAKDYGVWDYESWADWNKKSSQFPLGKQISANDATAVDTVIKGKDRDSRDIFEKLHFRLAGVFPTIKPIKDKLLAAVALYELKYELGEFGGFPINDLWTLGEIYTIIQSPELEAKTAFYGEAQGEYANRMRDVFPAAPGDNRSILERIRPDIDAVRDRFRKTATDVQAKIQQQYQGPDRRDALMRVGKMFFNVPAGEDFVMADVVQEVAQKAQGRAAARNPPPKAGGGP